MLPAALDIAKDKTRALKRSFFWKWDALAMSRYIRLCVCAGLMISRSGSKQVIFSAMPILHKGKGGAPSRATPRLLQL